MQRKLNEEFIKEYSEQFSEKVTSNFFEDKEEITGREILTITPSKQVNYFILKSLFAKWQEEMKKLESPYFDYKNTEVRRAMVDFMNVLSQHIQLSGDHFIELATEAVENTIKLLLAPHQYLEEELSGRKISDFSDKVSKPMMRYIKLRKSQMEAFFEQYSGDNIETALQSSVAYFEDLDDEEIIAEELANLRDVLAVSLDEFFEQEAASDSSDEPDYEEEEDGFEVESEVDEQEVGEGEAIEEDVDEEMSNQPEAIEVPSQPIQDETQEEVPDSDSEEPEAEEPAPLEDAEDAQPIAVNQEVESEEESIDNEEESITDESPSEPEATESEELEESEEAEEDSVNEKYSEQQATLNDKFSEGKNMMVDELQQRKVSSVMEAISVNHRYMFTKELFDGDKESFNAAIEEIETSETFDDAVELLVEHHAKERDWDMNSEEVKELLKIVFRKFR